MIWSLLSWLIISSSICSPQWHVIKQNRIRAQKRLRRRLKRAQGAQTMGNNWLKIIQLTLALTAKDERHLKRFPEFQKSNCFFWQFSSRFFVHANFCASTRCIWMLNIFRSSSATSEHTVAARLLIRCHRRLRNTKDERLTSLIQIP